MVTNSRLTENIFALTEQTVREGNSFHLFVNVYVSVRFIWSPVFKCYNQHIWT